MSRDLSIWRGDGGAPLLPRQKRAHATKNLESQSIASNHPKNLQVRPPDCHFHNFSLYGFENDRKEPCAMEKAKDDDFGGLIEFLVRELAINDWNKGMRASCVFFCQPCWWGGWLRGRHGTCNIGRDEEEEEEEESFMGVRSEERGVLGYTPMSIAESPSLIWSSGAMGAIGIDLTQKRMTSSARPSRIMRFNCDIRLFFLFCLLRCVCLSQTISYRSVVLI